LKEAFGIRVGIPVLLDSSRTARNTMLASSLDGSYLDYREF
jgi:uncharacterized protein YbaR (Trm112 family)